MVRHQAVGMHRTVMLRGKLAQQSEIHQSIAIAAEAIHAVDAALNYVDRVIREDGLRCRAIPQERRAWATVDEDRGEANAPGGAA